ncbi:MAG: hypothetical protein LUF84_05805 [Clostridiales bacterium]|nr:hypothetical protein [Clostridiales bacterium]
MRRTPLLLTSLTLALALLTGCGISAGSPEDYYRLPQASEEYESLETCLQEALNSGYEYVSPLKGTNTQPVSVVDLDGDGLDEAVAFFRDTDGGENPLKICLYQQNEDGEFSLLTTIEGQGNAINSVTFCQLDGGEDSVEEVLVSWQISSSVYTLSAYSVEEGAAVQMMDFTSYSRYSVVDLDADGTSELVVLQSSATDTTEKQAQYYACQDQRMALVGTAPLSQSLSSIDHVRTGVLSGGETALFVSGYVTDSAANEISNSDQITDIFALVDGVFTSVALDSRSGDSSTVHYYLTNDQDIDGDGIWEIPFPAVMANFDPESTDTFNALLWNQYDLTGAATLSAVTYYNGTDGWYLVLPEDWLARLSLARSDTTSGNTVERGILFYYQASSEEDAFPLFAIYKNTGTNRSERAAADSRFSLTEDSTATYSARLYDSAVEYGLLDAATLRSMFYLIETDWSED